MENFRTVIAVLVVLVAFTGFQLIANYSLRKAVRSDVKVQIEQTDKALAQLIRHQQEIGVVTQRLDALKSSADALKTSVEAAASKAGELDAAARKVAAAVEGLEAKVKACSTAVEALETKVKALSAGAASAEKKLGALGAAADGARTTRAAVETLRTQAAGLAGETRTARQQAEQALKELRGLRTQLSAHAKAVTPASMTRMQQDIGRLRTETQRLSGDVKKLAAALDAISKEDGGT